jgi:hypothetical protein
MNPRRSARQYAASAMRASRLTENEGISRRSSNVLVTSAGMDSLPAAAAVRVEDCSPPAVAAFDAFLLRVVPVRERVVAMILELVLNWTEKSNCTSRLRKNYARGKFPQHCRFAV